MDEDEAPAEEPTDLLDWIQDYINSDMPYDDGDDDDDRG